MNGSIGIAPSDIALAVERIASEIVGRHEQATHLVIMAIANGGIVLAQRLQHALGSRLAGEVELGVVDITFHRDDIMLRPITNESINTAVEADLDDAVVILVDDVLHTGRTVRAALNECFDQGRPARIELAVLIDRGDTHLPVRADYVGFVVDTHHETKLKVCLDPTNPLEDHLYFI